MSISNENFDVGGTGGALFGGPAGAVPHKGPKPGQEAMGDDYRPPPGVAGFKQPDYDDDDRVDPAALKAGKSTWLSRFFPDPVQQGLALAKSFYFFFFAAFGSLFPLMAVYFKQLGMNSAQTGFLIGVRPIVEYIATPVWNQMADKLQKGKIMLLVAVFSWILFTLPIGFVRPPVVSCKYYNGSHWFFKLPTEAGGSEIVSRERRSADFDFPERLSPDTVDELPMALPLTAMDVHPEAKMRTKRGAYDHQWAPGQVRGISPQTVNFYTGYDQNRHRDWVSPTYSNEIFEREGVHKVFFLILLLVIIGEFFSSPAVALADSAVITLLGEEHQDKYGSQRVFGSLGWGVTMFFMGMVLDHSRFTAETSKCDPSDAQKDYHVCFYVFTFLMFCALLVATQIPFKYSIVNTNSMPMGNMQPNGGGQGAQQKKPGQQPDQTEKLKAMAEKTKVFAQQLRSVPEFNAVFRAMANLRLLTFFLVAWIMGIGMGLIFTFLFWHLQDYGGGPTLFGIASVINHLSEMAAYFYSFKLISSFGHIKVLAAGLLCNCLRFLYISFITWPWFILPVEFVQGITHAAVWAACCSFLAHNTSAELRPSAQGVLQGVHHGFGKFCGAVIGGILIKSQGTVVVFRAYGIVCLVFLVIFLAVNFATRDEGGDGAADMDPTAGLESGGPLGPHGVPTAPMPRALSSSKLEEQEQQAVEQPSGPNLGVPGGGANNPFLADAANYNAAGQPVAEGGGQYYGRGYSQAQSGYSSSGFGLQ